MTKDQLALEIIAITESAMVSGVLLPEELMEHIEKIGDLCKAQFEEEPLKEVILKEMDELSVAITSCQAYATVIATHINRGQGGREISLTITKLQEAQSWLRYAKDELTPSHQKEQ